MNCPKCDVPLVPEILKIHLNWNVLSVGMGFGEVWEMIDKVCKRCGESWRVNVMMALLASLGARLENPNKCWSDETQSEEFHTYLTDKEVWA